ncbi:MAG: outer membrane beta-barrel protein [Candidatus Polarisedimenticolia bacterium]
MRVVRFGSILLLALLAVTTLAPAAEFELTPFYGYRIGGELDDVDISADDSASYGVTFGVSLNEIHQIEFLWSHQGTEVDLDDFQIQQQEITLDVDLDHYQVGWLLQGGADDDVKPYFSLHLGILDISPEGIDSESYFSWSLGGGAKIFMNDTIGFRLAARWAITLVDTDNAYYCDWYGFCYSGTDADYFNQTEFSAGLIFRFGN